jgi:predicted phosphoribosyltransferase
MRTSTSSWRARSVLPISKLAIGAITADGSRLLNRDLIALIGVSDASLDRLAAEQRAEAQRREQRFRRGCDRAGGPLRQHRARNRRCRR